MVVVVGGEIREGFSEVRPSALRARWMESYQYLSTDRLVVVVVVSTLTMMVVVVVARCK